MLTIMVGGQKKTRRSGFTLVEIVIDIFVITVIFSALIGSFMIVLNTVSSGQTRSGASALANEQMELLRNMPYDNLSTQGGTILPQGTIPDTQVVSRSGVAYILTTTVIYIDDPFDGCAIPAVGGKYECTDGDIVVGQDLIPVDYKRISIEVTKQGDPLILARVSSNAAAKAAETSSNTGILLVIINDAEGNALEGVTVTIYNADLGITLSGTTNAKGYLFVAGLPPDNQNGYHISATIDGYSVDYTTERTAQNPNQVQPDVDVNAQQITTQTLAIDVLGTLTATVYDTNGNPKNNMEVKAVSSKITQFNPDLPKHIYTQSTNNNGVVTFNNVEWDSYSLTVPDGFYIVTTSPYQKIAVPPGETASATMTVTPISVWPRIINGSPTSAEANTTVSIQLIGENFLQSSTLLMRKTGSTDLLPTSLEINNNQRSLIAVFNLAGASSGNWDIVFTNPNNQTATQKEGFYIP